ncbi:hypothetical protein BDR22DRAFT_499397 [Usnea florida]
MCLLGFGVWIQLAQSTLINLFAIFARACHSAFEAWVLCFMYFTLLYIKTFAFAFSNHCCSARRRDRSGAKSVRRGVVVRDFAVMRLLGCRRAFMSFCALPLGALWS